MIRTPVHLIRALGFVLIVLGGFAFAAQVAGLDIGAFIWPFFVILPGALLFFFGITLEDSLAEPLVMLSGLLTAAGLLLLYQSATGHWTSWAYAWALVAPGGAGLAQMLYGGLKRRQSAIRSGSSLVNIGLLLFGAGLVFFELILNISGFGLGFIGWPILFIGLGVYLLARGALRRHRKRTFERS